MEMHENRAASLAQTYANISRHVDAKTGIIPWVCLLPTPYASDAFYISVAKHSILAQIQTFEALRRNLGTASSAIGKGVQESHTLAICEALERWSTSIHGTEYAEHHTLRELQEQAVPPAVLHGFSERQYRNRHATRHASGASFIPEPLDLDRPVAWCPVYSLTHNDWKYVLKSSCYFGWHDEGRIFSAADSRGVAAGPDREFCLRNGLLELIETDAGAIWNGNFLEKPEVDIASFEQHYFDQLVAVHNDLGRDLWALDITADIPGVTIMAAVSRDRRTDNVVLGFGAHPVASRALEKALMECCQMLPNVISPEGNVTEGSIVRTMRDASSTNPDDLVPCPVHFLPSRSRGVRRREDYVRCARVETLQDLVRALARKGVEVLVQDLTRPSLGLVVMRVFGVHLRSWFDRRGPGRLYTVPVALGERTAPLAEADVNASAIET